ncbi:MAG: DUF5009 domain-containing protein [Chitinophagaceae bacterium]
MATLSQRFVSLDVFRGMTICFMIIVNTPGSGAEAFSPLQHAAWHGFTPTDLVFPSFLFAVGNAMSFSMYRYKQMGNAALLTRVIRRTVLIFLLGYLMYWYPFFRWNDAGSVVAAPWRDTRIMGVLQRIALCYFFASLLIHYLSSKKVFVISLVLLVGYWMILLAWGNQAQPFSLTGNAGLYFDRWFFGESHLYHGEGIAFDPEGLAGTLPAIVNVLIGYYSGRYIQKKGKGFETLTKLLLAGTLLIFTALCWNMVFPINKKLWSSSFVLLTTGIDLVIIAALIFIIEIKNWNRLNWTNFFLVFGKNPLFIYLLSEILLITASFIRVAPGLNLYTWINNVFFQVIAPGALGSFLFAIVFMFICWCIGWWLDKRHIYVKV